ncbi:MAG TPA: DNA-invertase [Planctomycetaceae bacterium]|nr:DNA-invertase [Planctomycetaceae bacterium]
MKLKHVAIYLRVSSKKQDHRSQEPDLKRWAEAQDEPIMWYRDKATGRTMDRPAWNRLEADMRLGKISAVVVWRLDRLGRTCSGLTKLFEELRDRRVNLISLKDAIDLSTASGRLLAHVLASVAEYENEVRGERIRAGQAVARTNGTTWGGSEKGRRLKVTDEQVKVVRRLKRDGEGVTAIARATGLSRPTVYRILHE